MNHKSVIFILLIFLIAGCSKNPNMLTQEHQEIVKKDQTINQIKNSKNKNIVMNQVNKPKKISTPPWILNPEKDNFICGVGSAPLRDNRARVAKMRAKASISEQIRVHLKSQMTIEKKCSGEECQKVFSSKIEQQATNMLNKVTYPDSYTDNKANTYYIRACIKK